MSSTSQLSSSPFNLNNNEKLIFQKANKIHLKLLTFIQNELNQQKINTSKKFSFFEHNKSVIVKEEKNKSDKHEQKSSDTNYNSDGDNDEEESSSDMSCNEECSIDL